MACRGARPGGRGDGGAERVADAVSAAGGHGQDCWRSVLDGIRGWRQLLDERPSRLDCLDEWSRRHIETLAAIEDTVGSALKGDTLLHTDLRADNILLTPERTWFVDWPHACAGLRGWTLWRLRPA